MGVAFVALVLIVLLGHSSQQHNGLHCAAQQVAEERLFGITMIEGGDDSLLGIFVPSPSAQATGPLLMQLDVEVPVSVVFQRSVACSCSNCTPYSTTVSGSAIHSLVGCWPMNDSANWPSPSPGLLCSESTPVPFHGLASLFTLQRSQCGRWVAGTLIAVDVPTSVTVVEYTEHYDSPSVIWPQLLPAAFSGFPGPAFFAASVKLCGTDISTLVASDGSLESTGVVVRLSLRQSFVSAPPHVLSGIFAFANLTHCEETASEFVCRDVPRKLPSLKIAVSSTETIEILLTDLVENGTDRLLRLGKVVTPKEQQEEFGTYAPLVLGWRAWRSFLYISMFGQVGLVPQRPAAAATESVCNPSPKCRDTEVFIPHRNKCVNPSCAVYLFRTYNDETNECTLRWSGAVVVLLAILITCGEFALTLYKRKLLRKVEARKRNKNVFNVMASFDAQE